MSLFVGYINVDRHQECDRAQGINRRRFDHAGCTRFQFDGAVNVEPLSPAGLFKRNLCVLWCPTARRSRLVRRMHGIGKQHSFVIAAIIEPEFHRSR